MHLKTILYTDYEIGLPQSGNVILGQIKNDTIFVYQAFNSAISQYALKHQKFGGAAYSFNRMSWIKPNFLWMMFRAGWARKANQEHILAIEIPLTKFELILAEAAYTSFQATVYETVENWKKAMAETSVRLQWDPDHHPNGTKLERRAIQLGLKDSLLKAFATEWVVSIQDITPFVLEQGANVAAKEWTKLMVPKEEIVPISTEILRTKLGLTV